MSKENSSKDRIFTQSRLPGDFVFDDAVAGVFEDMINRSVPGYSTIIAMIGVLAERYYQEGSKVYDLGCSLGGASFSILKNGGNKAYSIVAIDNSSAMIERLLEKKRAWGADADQLECRCADIQQSEISNASMVILNFTLQFVSVAERASLIKKIYQGMNPGGLLVVSEKIVFADHHLNDLLIESYHQFKETMGYSKLEISQKRTALENVLIPESLDVHKQRILQAGFSSFETWFQCFNFASMLAVK